MATIPYLYKRLRALGIPHSQAELFADQNAELPSGATAMGVVAQLDPDEELLTNAVDKINELIVALQAAGLMDEEA